MSVIEKYYDRVKAADSLLCIGLDSDMEKMPPRFQNIRNPQFTFNRWVIDQTYTRASAYKINTAFYEARGEVGWYELQLTMSYLQRQHADILTIGDVKRGDIGSSNQGYATALFDQLGFDAITLNPYVGRAAMQPFLDRADKGCIILCRTSNDGAEEFQQMQVGNRPLWELVLEHVRDDWNGNQNCMLVVGATQPDDLHRARELAPDMPLLVPGVGAQGGDPEAVVKAAQDANGLGLIINASRSVIFAEYPAEAARKLQAALNAARNKREPAEDFET